MVHTDSPATPKWFENADAELFSNHLTVAENPIYCVTGWGIYTYI